MKFLLRSIVLGFLFTISAQTFGDPSIYKKILNQNLQSCDFEEPEFNEVQYREYLIWAFKTQENLWEYRKRRVAFLMLDKHALQNQWTESPVLNDPVVWRDLTFFCGQKDAKSYLADKVDRTHTAIGKAFLYGMLAQPVSDIDILEKRQAVIRQLIENEELFNELSAALDAYKKSENMLLSFYCATDPFKQISARRFFGYGTKKINGLLNRSEAILNIRNSVDHLQRITFAATSIIATPLLPLCGFAQLANYQLPESVGEVNDNLRGSHIPFFGMISPLCKNKLFLGGLSIAAGVVSALNLKENWDWMADNFLIDTYIQAKIMHIARIMEAIRSVEKCVNKNSTISSSLDQYGHISQLLNNHTNHSLQNIFKLLASDTFNSPPSLARNKGKIFVAYKLFEDNKQEFEPTILAIGEIDAYMSIATLYKEFKRENAHCCFAEYKKDSKPSIDLQEFWNPFVEVQKVVPNSLSLGAQGNRRDMVLTGPNAGGKSTLLKAIAINVIMAQSFGIAAAQKIVITPFHKILTYLNITDDIGVGNSLFKAQVLRAQMILDTIKSLPQDHYSFSIIDEMFNGTSPKEAQACAYSVAKNLSSYENNISIVATHFALLTQLETQTEHFANYHVGVERLRNGGIKYPFKLIAGISDQHVALDILKAEGFEGSIVAEAQEILAQA